MCRKKCAGTCGLICDCTQIRQSAGGLATESRRRPADGQLQLELAGAVQAGGRTTAAGDRSRQAAAPGSRRN